MYQRLWHLPIVLPAQVSETARGKGDVILEADSFSCLPERVFGTLTTFFVIQVSFLFFIMKWEKKPQLFFLSFACFVIYFGSSLHVGFFYWCLYTACIMLGPSSMYIWKYFHEYRFSTKFNYRNLLFLLTSVTYIWLLFAKNFQSLL